MGCQRKIRNTKYQIPNTVRADHSGVTLLELTVSVFLFTLTVVLAAGIFTTIVNSQRITVASEDLQENIRYDFEKMGKEIRTAQKDPAHSCIPAGNIYWNNNGAGDQLMFLNYRGQCVKYGLKNGQVYVYYPKSTDPALANGLPLTPKEISISGLAFRVIDSAAEIQALVTMRMRLSVAIKGAPAEQIDMETSLSSRSYQ
ncbi:MAG TPA: hypothetical protein VMC41_01985 [Candidatus Nanoarchaeia archaeon]|nr:hypothetical protein [Candidatus Nanoarchaeia archaeon]